MRLQRQEAPRAPQVGGPASPNHGAHTILQTQGEGRYPGASAVYPNQLAGHPAFQRAAMGSRPSVTAGARSDSGQESGTSLSLAELLLPRAWIAKGAAFGLTLEHGPVKSGFNTHGCQVAATGSTHAAGVSIALPSRKVAWLQAGVGRRVGIAGAAPGSDPGVWPLRTGLQRAHLVQCAPC
jgi:hypothetical protein